MYHIRRTGPRKSQYPRYKSCARRPFVFIRATKRRNIPYTYNIRCVCMKSAVAAVVGTTTYIPPPKQPCNNNNIILYNMTRKRTLFSPGHLFTLRTI